LYFQQLLLFSAHLLFAKNKTGKNICIDFYILLYYNFFGGDTD